MLVDRGGELAVGLVAAVRARGSARTACASTWPERLNASVFSRPTIAAEVAGLARAPRACRASCSRRRRTPCGACRDAARGSAPSSAARARRSRSEIGEGVGLHRPSCSEMNGCSFAARRAYRRASLACACANVSSARTTARCSSADSGAPSRRTPGDAGSSRSPPARAAVESLITTSRRSTADGSRTTRPRLRAACTCESSWTRARRGVRRAR